MLDEAQGSLSGFDFHVSPASESFYDWMYAAHSRLAALPPNAPAFARPAGTVRRKVHRPTRWRGRHFSRL